MFGFDHPFFRPLWRRILVVVLTLGWAVVELVGGAPFWALLFGALGAAALWGLLINYDPEGLDKEKRK